MIDFLGFPGRDMFWKDKQIKYDNLLGLFSARDTFWTGKLIKNDTIL